MSSKPPEYTLLDSDPDTVELMLSGIWQQGQRPARFSRVKSDLASRHLIHLTADGSALGEWDSVLMGFLLQCHDYCNAQGIVFEVRDMPHGVEQLLAVATAVEARPADAQKSSCWCTNSGNTSRNPSHSPAR
jgi:phospholipid/cholesterol/gamma-HCH transport system permease protein